MEWENGEANARRKQKRPDKQHPAFLEEQKVA